MSAYDDYYRDNNVVSTEDIARLRRKIINRGLGQEVALYNPEVDLQWARTSNNSDFNLSYFDYYFSGQDIKVSITELETYSYNELPIIDLAFQIEQEKAPVYGFWSHTYSAMLHGTRIVTGAFTIATRYPGYMTEMLKMAAESRSRSGGAPTEDYGRSITSDDANIDKYWGKTLDDSLMATGPNLFSNHPPFSFTIQYGIQSISADSAEEYNHHYARLDQSNEEVMDVNHRLVAPGSDQASTRFYIDAIDLKSVQRSFGATGDVAVEMYTFIARDVVIPPPALR